MIIAKWTGGNSNSDFGLHWIEDKYLIGTETVRGKECLVFQAPDYVAHPDRAVPGDIRAQADDPRIPENIREMIRSRIADLEKAGKTMTKVWISAETRLPVQIQDSERTSTFEFGPGPGSLTIPAGYAAEIRKLRELYPISPSSRPE
ncbi:MAG: hypothetical protein SFU53_14610 [Terrimicrobiaceae bacterium]|nr:hypothetical protein [Terrimicrobiaceae bacterium]